MANLKSTGIPTSEFREIVEEVFSISLPKDAHSLHESYGSKSAIIEAYKYLEASEDKRILYERAGDLSVRAFWRLSLQPEMSFAEFQAMSDRFKGQLHDLAETFVFKTLRNQIRAHHDLQEKLNRVRDIFAERVRKQGADQATVGSFGKTDFPTAIDAFAREILTDELVDEKTAEAAEIRDELAPARLFKEDVFETVRKAVVKLPFPEFLKCLREEESDAIPNDFALFGRETIDRWRSQTVKLEPDVISSFHEINQEFILWLATNPNALETISWQAFEKLIAEIFASAGFQVDYTARSVNRSADLIAVTTDRFGATSRYLIECKRYRKSRRIGLDIVNAVLGAAKRESVDHAFLVTTSYFTRNVHEQRSQFAELRLHLRDGDAVQEWLHDYNERTDGGLWLPVGWDQ